MKITTGTNHFPHFHSAVWHYRQHNPELSMAEMNSWIHSKIENKEIKIGKPAIKDGQELKIIDNRYHICE